MSIESLFYKPWSAIRATASTTILFRDASDAKGAVIGISASRDKQVFNNVVKNMAGGTTIISMREAGPGGTASQVYNSIFCNVNTYSTDVRYGLIVSNSSYGAPLSSCNAEEQRILIEMQDICRACRIIAERP